MNKFNGVTYYGRLIKPEEALVIEDREGRYPLCTNNMQGESAKKFIEELYNMPGLKVLMDYDESSERADMIIIWDIAYAISEGCSVTKLIEIIGKSRPDECNQFEQDTIRLWWD